MSKSQSRATQQAVSTLSTTTKAAPKAQLSRLNAAGHDALAMAKRGAKGAAHTSSAFVKEHPVVAAGALAGVAMVVGVIAERTLHHEPTLGELVKSTLKGSAKGLSKAIVGRTKRGVGAAAKSLSDSLR